MVVDRGRVSAENLKVVRKGGYHLLGIVRGEPKGTYAALGRWEEEALERPQNLLRRPSRRVLYTQNWKGSLLVSPSVSPWSSTRTGRWKSGRDEICSYRSWRGRPGRSDCGN
jgi:hypothetical protein